MGLLDQIANPQGFSMLEHLKITDMLEQRKLNRQMAEIQTGQYLAQMKAAKTAQENQTKGRGLIESYMERNQAPREVAPPSASPTESWDKTGAAIDQAITQGPQEPTPLMMQKAINPIIGAVSKIPMTEIKSKDYGELADKLITIPGMEETAKMFYDLDQKIEDRNAKMTENERKADREVFEAAINPIKSVATMEESGDLKGAEAEFNRLRDFITSDPRFNKNKDMMKFYEVFSEYRPGLGKYMYLSAMTREQMQKEESGGEKASDWAKFTDNEGKEWLVNKLTDERKPLGKSWQAAKEEGIQGRSEAAAGRQAEKAAMDKEKFNVRNTDKIITFKQQEQKDLKEIKGSLSRAITLAAEGKNMSLVDKLLQQSMSKWENTSVRAFAELERFKNLGDIEQRVAGHVSQFFAGEMTDEQRKMAIDTAKTLLDDVIDPTLTESDKYWAGIAADRNLDPDQVFRFPDKESVGEAMRDGWISRAQAAKILQKSRFKVQ